MVSLQHNHHCMRLPIPHPYHLLPSPDQTPTLLALLAPPLLPAPSPPTPPLKLPSRTARLLAIPDPSSLPLRLIQALLHMNATRGTTLQHSVAGDTLLIKELPTWLLGKSLSQEDWRWCLNQDPMPIPSPSSPALPHVTQPPSNSNAMYVNQ